MGCNSGAESWETLNARVTASLARIHRAHPDQKVVAVVHGGVIGHILAHATGASPLRLTAQTTDQSRASSCTRAVSR